MMKEDDLKKYIGKVENGERLTYDEESDLCLFMMGAYSDTPDAFKRFESICSDQIFVSGYFLSIGDDVEVREISHRNYDPTAELQKRIDAFEDKYDSNASNLFHRQVRKEYNIELKEARSKYVGADLEEKIRSIKSKLEYLRLRSDRLYEDYTNIHGMSSIDLVYSGVPVIFDKVSIMHIMNRHVVSNAYLGLNINARKSRLNITNLEQIVDSIKYLFSVLSSDGQQDINKQLNFYFKRDLSGPVYAVHTKLVPESTAAGANKIHRVETYYPVTDSAKLTELKARGIVRLRQDMYLYNSDDNNRVR